MGPTSISRPGKQLRDDVSWRLAGRSPDVEVLHVDVLVWGRLSLAPEEKPFLGRGLCRTHKDGEHKLTTRGAAPSAGGHPRGSGRRGREKLGKRPWDGAAAAWVPLPHPSCMPGPRSSHSPGVTLDVTVTGQCQGLNLSRF